MQFTAVSWNLFHGRDFPPEPELRTWRSRLLRMTERGETHAQVNRGLEAEFAEVLAGASWDVALLQECPPRFEEPLALACDAEPHRVLTSRNSLAPLRGLAARLNPDLVASAEGGSNLTLVRRRRAAILERGELEIHSGRPERRAMALTRVEIGGAELCVANLHATNDQPALAVADILLAAEASASWAGDAPLLFGGDLNLRPGEDPGVFDVLREQFALEGTTGPRAIDHLLCRGLVVVEPATAWPAAKRELRRSDGLALRLSDHAPVSASFAILGNPPAPGQECDSQAGSPPQTDPGGE